MSHPFEQDFNGPIDVTIGNLRVQAGYALLTYSSLPVAIYITPREGEDLTLRIEINFEQKNISTIQTRASEDGRSISFNIPSSVSEFTVGAGEPMRIGVADNKELFIAMKCIDMGDQMKALYFSIYTRLHD